VPFLFCYIFPIKIFLSLVIASLSGFAPAQLALPYSTLLAQFVYATVNLIVLGILLKWNGEGERLLELIEGWWRWRRMQK